MPKHLTMAETADEIGLSYEHFRRVWPAMNAQEGFPAPIHTKVWLASAVEAWAVERSKRVLACGTAGRRRSAGAAADAPAPPAVAQVRRARRSLDAARAT